MKGFCCISTEAIMPGTPFCPSAAKKSLPMRCSSWFSRKYSIWSRMSSVAFQALLMAAAGAWWQMTARMVSYMPTLS